jgi:hypothetical protein
MSLEVEFSHIARHEMKMMQTHKDHTCYPFTMIIIKHGMNVPSSHTTTSIGKDFSLRTRSSQAMQKVKVILEFFFKKLVLGFPYCTTIFTSI